MHEIWALAGKDLRLLLRDKAGFFFTFFFPLIIAVFFGSIFGSPNRGNTTMRVLFIDEDQTPGSRAFTQLLEDADEIDLQYVTREQAETSVRKGQAIAYLAILPGFGDKWEQLFWGEAPEVEVGVDPSRTAEAAMIQGILMKYASTRYQAMFNEPETMRGRIGNALTSMDANPDDATRPPDPVHQLLLDLDRFYAAQSDAQAETPSENASQPTQDDQAMKPIEVKTRDVVREYVGPRNSYAVSFPQGIIWGILGVAAAFGISIVTERTRGTLIRLLVSPVSLRQILAGKALACFGTTLANTLFLLALAVFIFDVEIHAPLLLLMSALSSCFCFVGIMMFLAVLGKTEQAAGGIGWAVLLIMSMLGGGMIPLFVMPEWLITLSHISPVKWAILSLEGAMWRGFDLGDMLQPCIILVVVGAAAFLVGNLIFRAQLRRD